MTFSNKTYDILKWIAQYLLPALGTLYFALASIWGWGYGEQVIGTITAIDTFLGVLLGISSNNYQGDGTVNIDPTNPDGVSFEFAKSPEKFANQNTVNLKVNSMSDNSTKS